MKQITFEEIYTLGNIAAENAHYRHFHYPEMLIRYDSNFIEFKTLPSLTEFKEVEKYLRDYHLKRGQKHVKFYFPTNIKPTGELTAYLTDMGYEIGFLELYAIQPKDFPSVRNNPDIEIQVVTDKNLKVLLDLQYTNDLEFGSEFAKQKADLIKRQFEDQDIQQVLAFYKGSPAGYVDVIISNETVEIDNLTVDESFRNKGIASRLQKFVMDSFPEKVVILVADGEDTPREMYKKQNYKNQGFKYEAQKIYQD
ncbi:GNAT family N-acetyltransferase [Aquibacillus sp. 3ASR75-11]|uniref:GNAT family N-acetyltransferase n=1 Tax=Terrihalobacillus insolitus TaxID=2950438 RepID=A0A9X3WNM9_9BACI|nr:GNAT family N-acetyltransferase [Terrihalobacillus insolitus]MDC3412302.1 GNAT family N-acetyltransferase [Terrihalobacillus insolitus]MDC3423005.1 GNAT family N-acetyltransferase [Terrihalobacillus insolitus]